MHCIVIHTMGHKEATGRLATLRVYSERPRELFRHVDIDPRQKTGAASLAPEMHQAKSTIARSTFEPRELFSCQNLRNFFQFYFCCLLFELQRYPYVNKH